jgi:hypothetical protein
MFARLKLLRRLTGAFGVPADLRRSELFWHEPDGALGIGVGDGGGDLADSGIKLLQSDGTRLWLGQMGAADGSTEFTGDGAGLTGLVATGSNADGAWYDVAGVLRLCIGPVLSSTSTTAEGNVFRSGNLTWDFPQPFASGTPIAGGLALTNSENAWFTFRATSSTAATVRFYTATSVATARQGRPWAFGLI